MKKIICLILAVIIAVACCSCAKKDFSQYDSAVVEVGNVNAKAGQTVKVKVGLYNNPGTSTIGLELHYDTEALTPIEIKKTGVLKDTGFFSSNITEDEYGVMGDEGSDYLKGLWFDAYDFDGNGEIMTITFQVADDASGVYPLTVVHNEDDLTNQDFEYVDVVFLDGSITVS